MLPDANLIVILAQITILARCVLRLFIYIKVSVWQVALRIQHIMVSMNAQILTVQFHVIENIIYLDPKYLVKALFDTTTSDDEVNSLVDTVTNNSTNFLTNSQNIFGYLDGKRILGGCLVWGDSKFAKVFDLSLE